eukprot:m51a1_g6939 putative glutamate decarboxylase (475) ;mRNA; r:238107-239531
MPVFACSDQASTSSTRFPDLAKAAASAPVPVFDMTRAEYVALLGRWTSEMNAGATEFPSARYCGHMNYDVSTAHLDALKATLVLNQNNVAVESSGSTTRAETEFVSMLARDLGLSDTAWGYVCSGGTVANIEALWVARNKDRALAPCTASRRRAVLASKYAHYSVRKACDLLDLELRQCPVDARGRMRAPEGLDASVLAVVATVGTTEYGVVDDVCGLARWCRANGSWLHADAAYGGYFAYALRTDARARLFDNDRVSAVNEAAAAVENNVESFDALALCDSLTIDPHKCGFAPYATGVFLLRDGSDKQHVCCTSHAAYVDSSATSSWTLEGSRSGAIAAAACFGHRVLRVQYPLLMADLLRGSAALKRAIDARPERLERIGSTGLAIVVFRTSRNPERMPLYVEKLCRGQNTHDGGITLVSTELDSGSKVFRAVVMNPSFWFFSDKFVASVTSEMDRVDRELEAQDCNGVTTA